MRKALSLTLMLIALFVLAIGPAPVSAQAANGPDQPPDGPAAGQAGDYLLLLNSPRLSALSDPSVSAFTRLVEESARPVLSELEAYQQAGIIGQVALRAQQNVIAVEVLQADKAGSIAQIPGVAKFAPADTLTSCVQNSTAALPKLIQQLGGYMASPDRPQPGPALQVSAPTFKVFTLDTYNYGWVIGNTGANALVHLTITRGQATLIDLNFMSNNGPDGVPGYFDYEPFWMGCGEWDPTPGDVVAVTANGLTTITSLAPLSAWADPATGKVSGKTSANKIVRIDLTTNLRNCISPVQTQTVTADSSGSFQASFAAFKGDSEAVVSVLDGNAATAWDFEAPHLSVTTQSINGTLHPNTPFTLTFTRQGGTVPAETITGVSSGWGGFYAYLSNTPATGDSIKVVETGITTPLTLTYTFSGWGAVTVGATTVSGTAQTGDTIKSTYGSVWPLSCSNGSKCAGRTVTNADGTFTITYSGGLPSGSSIEYRIYDSQGNDAAASTPDGSTFRSYVPFLLADLGYKQLRGAWEVGNRSLTLMHKRGGSTILQYTFETSSDGSFYLNAYSPILAGDVIEVTDNVDPSKVRSMTVPAVSGVLNNDTNKITGSDPATGKKVIAFYSHLERAIDGRSNTCKETTAASGAYSFDLSPVDVIGQDSADLVFTGADGYFTRLSIHALGINAMIDDTWVTGYALVPNTPITGKLYNGASLVSQIGSVSTSASSFVLDFGVKLTPGLKVEVTNSGVTGSLTIPTLSGAADLSARQVAGASPAKQPVKVILVYPNHHYDAQPAYLASADDGGYYSAKFEQIIANCYPYTQVAGGCAQVKVIYTQPDGHSVEWDGQKPAQVRADAYEFDNGDNSRTYAFPYLGVSHHTFHNIDDRDWISFQVTQANVDAGIPLTLETSPGPRMATTMRLIDPEGDSMYSGYDYTGASRLTFTPTMVGTYYVEMTPYDPYNTVDCGAYYDFFIYTSRHYLPSIER